MHDDSSTLIAADSLRVVVCNGVAHARGWHLHARRFCDAVQQQIAPYSLSERTRIMSDLDHFIDEARVKMRAYGEGFPRLECWQHDGTLRLSLSLRPTPLITDSLRLRHVGEIGLAESALSKPANIKGPRIAEYTDLNRSLGAEALLTADDGTIIEGTTVSLVVWHGDTLALVPQEHSPEGKGLARVPSVTESLVQHIAQQSGYSVVSKRTHHTEMQRCETWALNALHGIRRVTHLGADTLPNVNSPRLTEARAALGGLNEPL